MNALFPFHWPALLAVVVLTLLTSGCDRGSKAPELISTDQVSSGVPEMFKSAPTEVRQLATEAAEAIKSQEFAVAWEKLQALNSRTGLTDDQKAFVAQSISSVGAEMQKSEESGNEAAEQALKFHRANK